MVNLRNLDKKITQKTRKLMNMKMSTVMKKDRPGNEQRKKHQRKLFLMLVCVTQNFKETFQSKICSNLNPHVSNVKITVFVLGL